MNTTNWISFLKYLGLFVGCIAKFTSGSLFVFNAYQNAIKSTFNYTQTEVELLSSMLNLGLGTGFLPGMIYDKFGPQLTSGLGLIVSGGAYFLIWSTTRSIEYYRTRSGLMAFYFYLAGFGSLFSYMAALNTNVINFSAKHRGKVISLLNAFFTGSPSVFVVIYYNFFTDGDYNVVENQKYGDFMFFFAILFIVMNIACIICIHDLSKKVASNVDVTPQDNNSIQQSSESVNKTDEKQVQKSEKKDSIRLVTVLKNPSFHLLACSFTLAAVLGLVNTNNITVLTKSVYLSHYDSTLLIVMPVINTIISFFIGPLSDKVKDKVPRLTFFLMACIVFTLSELIYVFWGNTLAGIISAILVTGFGIGIIWSLVPAIVSEMFGVPDFGRNWGIMLLMAGVVGFGGQAVFGRLYDMMAEPGQIYCYGKVCTIYGFIFMAILGIVSIAISAILDIRHRYLDSYNEIM